MNKVNQVLLGALSAVVAPAIVWLIFDVWHNDWVLPDRPAVPYLIAIAVNLFILRYNIRKGNESLGYGVMGVTFVFAILVFILKFKH